MKRRRLVIGIGAAALLAIVATLFSGDQGIVALYRTWRQMQQLTDELKTSRRTIDSLNVEIKRLTSDTGYIERVAREKYGMARKNEKMYKFIEGK